MIPNTVTDNTPNNLPVQYLKASEFVKLSVSEFSKLTGKNLNWFQRLSFRITKLRLKHDLKKNPDLKITDYDNHAEKDRSFNFLWFILGLAIPIIGLATGSFLLFAFVAIAPIVLAYAAKQDRRSKIKSVWMGFGLGILFILILGIIAISSFGG
jgi:hypothetical protein